MIFPLAASRQLRRALTIRYRDSSVDSNIPGTTSINAAPRANVASIIIRFYIDAGKPSKGPSRRALKIRGPRRGSSPSPGWGLRVVSYHPTKKEFTVEEAPAGSAEPELSLEALRLRVRQQELLADYGVFALKGTAFPELLDHGLDWSPKGCKRSSPRF